MLRRRGIDAELNYGLRRTETGTIEAHVWVAAGGRELAGGADAHLYARVACFP
jgi:hypothetical protein